MPGTLIRMVFVKHMAAFDLNRKKLTNIYFQKFCFKVVSLYLIQRRSFRIERHHLALSEPDLGQLVIIASEGCFPLCMTGLDIENALQIRGNTCRL